MEIKKLIEKIDLNYPELFAAKSLYEKGDLEGCLDEIIRHFATRDNPKYLFERSEMEGFEDEKILEEAEEILNHKIFGYQFEGEIDWMFNPTGDTSRDNEWSWSLYRHLPWQVLARAYVMTGDEKYTKEFVTQLKDWFDAWPVEKFLESREHDRSFTFPGSAWREIESAMRIYTTWMPCYIAFRESKAWDKKAWLYFLISICDHAEYLTKYYSNHRTSSNWLSMEASALLQLGILFPEMKNSETWFETGYRRYTHEVKYSFDNDGVHMERTPIYHMVASNAFFQAYQICKLNDVVVPPYAWPTLEKSAEFIFKLVKPDFSTPMIGDADRNCLLSRKCDTSLFEGMNLTFNTDDLNEMRAYFMKMHEFTGRDDFLYFATKGEQGNAPSERNYAIKDAGIYVMRTGWQANDSYYHLHGIQLERGERSTHSHIDQLHLELQIKGEDVLIDSGRYIYNSSCWKNWRHYFLSANAHNTVFIDDHEMGKVMDSFRIRGARTYCHEFEENDDYSIIDLSHNGYAFTQDPIFHRRKVIRLAGDIYIIDDNLTGLGKMEHDIRLHFNFAPGEVKNTEGNNYIYTNDKGTEFNYYSLINDGVTSQVLKGSEDPIGGWVSYGYSEREPIPQLCLKTRGPIPVRFISVICPSGIECKSKNTDGKMQLEFSGEVSKKVILNEDEIKITN